MSNIYDMAGNKKVLFTAEPQIEELTYKEIMKIIIENATEEGCKEIFLFGGINLCPSEIFGTEKINKQKEDEDCNYNNITCTKCWSQAVKQLEKEKK